MLHSRPRPSLRACNASTTELTAHAPSRPIDSHPGAENTNTAANAEMPTESETARAPAGMSLARRIMHPTYRTPSSQEAPLPPADPPPDALHDRERASS